MSDKMSARDLQHILARIYTDASVRESFLSGNESFLSEYALSEKEMKSLRTLRDESRERINFFSSLLVKKHQAKIKALFPITYAALGEGTWGEAWSAYCHEHCVENPALISTEANLFSEFLESFVATNRPEIQWLGDLIIYERCKLFVALSPRMKMPPSIVSHPENDTLMGLYPVIHHPFKLMLFNHNLTSVISRLKETEKLPEVEPEQTLFLFYRRWTEGGVGVARVGSWLAKLIEKCDGRASVRDIIEGFSTSNDGATSCRASCERALIQLAPRGVLAFSLQPLL